MVHVNYYAKRLGDGIRVKMFHWARRADPKAILYVNDYNIISGKDGPKYVKHIEGLIALYRTCFAHPSVEGILMWGFWEGRHWRPKAALWKRDFTPTPAAKAYRKLIYETWWTKWNEKTDASGRCEAPAYFGRHTVKVGNDSREVNLPRAKGKVELDVRKQR